MPKSTQAFAWLIGVMLVVVMAWSVMHPHLRTGIPQAQNGEPTGLRVDLNTADAAMLELLPGVGPSIAMNIIDAREGGAVFQRAEDLEPVKFIGPSIIRRVEPWVVSKVDGGG